VPVTKEITRLEKSNVRLSMTVPKEDVRSQYQEVLKELAKNAQIPGFRKGKVPNEVLVRKFGDALKSEAMSKIIQKAIDTVFSDENLPLDERPLPYAQPRMDEEPQFEMDQDMVLSLVYDVMPQVSIGQWKGLEVEIPDITVTEDDIARELEEVRERSAFVLDRDEDAQAQQGDVVTVNYCELDENGETLPNSQRDDFVFTLGSRAIIYQIDDEIAGMKKGETKEVTKTFPEDSDIKELAGSVKKIRITLTAVKEKKLPNLDDELAQDIDEKYNTLDDLKRSIRERLEKALALRIKDMKINKLLEKIMENTPVTLPESMVKAEIDGRLRTTARRYGMDVEGLLRIMAGTGKESGEIINAWRAQAEKGLHSRLIVETIISNQHIEASDEEIEKELENIAADTGKTIEEVKKEYEDKKAREYVEEAIKDSKFFDMLLVESVIKTGSRANYLDVMQNNE